MEPQLAHWLDFLFPSLLSLVLRDWQSSPDTKQCSDPCFLKLVPHCSHLGLSTLKRLATVPTQVKGCSLPLEANLVYPLLQRPETSEAYPATPVPSSWAREQRWRNCTHRDLVSSDDSCQAPGTIVDEEMTPYLLICAGLGWVEHRVCLWKTRMLLTASIPALESQSGFPPSAPHKKWKMEVLGKACHGLY